MLIFYKDTAASTVNLQLFAGEGAAPAGTGDAGGQTGVNTPDAAENRKAAEYNAAYGKNTQNSADEKAKGFAEGTKGFAERTEDLGEKAKNVGDNSEEFGENKNAGEKNTEETDSATPQERYARLKKEFKEQFDADVQHILRSRLAKSSAAQKQLETLSPLIDTLSRRYGVADIEKIVTAVEQDDSMLSSAAAEKGMSIEQYKAYMALERENERLKAEAGERLRAAQAEKTYSDWLKQAQELKNIYPDFDIGAEAKNGRFIKLLKSGIGMRASYELVNRDKILEFAAKKGEQIALGKLAANAARPAENPLGAGAPAQQTVDVSKMTREDFRKIRERVARGERVTL